MKKTKVLSAFLSVVTLLLTLPFFLSGSGSSLIKICMAGMEVLSATFLFSVLELFFAEASILKKEGFQRLTHSEWEFMLKLLLAGAYFAKTAFYMVSETADAAGVFSILCFILLLSNLSFLGSQIYVNEDCLYKVSPKNRIYFRDIREVKTDENGITELITDTGVLRLSCGRIDAKKLRELWMKHRY